MTQKMRSVTSYFHWELALESFNSWIKEKQIFFGPNLPAEPTIKILIFLSLIDSNKECTYEDIRGILNDKNVIKGNIPDNTLRTSVLNLGKTLDKIGHPLELKSKRGIFNLIKRQKNYLPKENEVSDPVVLLLSPPAISAEEIANTFINKAMMPFSALYLLEWSARWWEVYSNKETESRVIYESNAWDALGIKDRLYNTLSSDKTIGFVSLGPGEGLAEIELLKKIFREDPDINVHYLAVDSSPRLLRDHIGLLRETLSQEIDNGRLLCGGVVANIFTTLHNSIKRVRNEFNERGLIKSDQSFLPSSCGLLVTYLGNCLGNNFQDMESEIFSIVHSSFKNRPLEFLVGVSANRNVPEEYKRTWDEFLLQTPKHLLQTKKLLHSEWTSDNTEPAEFEVPNEFYLKSRCPQVTPEPYLARHKIEGQIYRFYYELAYDLQLSDTLDNETRALPKGTLILLYNIIKYNMQSLVDGIEKCGLFKIKYDDNYKHIMDTANGIREYAVFCAHLTD